MIKLILKKLYWKIYILFHRKRWDRYSVFLKNLHKAYYQYNNTHVDSLHQNTKDFFVNPEGSVGHDPIKKGYFFTDFKKFPIDEHLSTIIKQKIKKN